MEKEKIDVARFDLRKTHMLTTATDGHKTVIQNGLIYDYTIPNPREPAIGGKIIGKIADMKPAIIALGHKFCDVCGFSFGESEGLEKHLYEVHRDMLLVDMIKTRPEELSIGQLPTEDQLKDQAKVIISGQQAEEAIAKAEGEKTPAQQTFDQKKAKNKGAYREPVKA